MLFDDTFVASLRADPINGVVAICKTAKGKITAVQGWSDQEYEALTEAFALLSEMQLAGLFNFETFLPDLENNKVADCSAILSFLEAALKECASLGQQARLETTRSRFRLSLGTEFSYEFTQGDLDRVQVLLNELRVQIATAGFLGEDHRTRLLARLEKLQGELHKKVSSLDRFWGMFSDAGIALGKFGTDAKPIFDRVSEMTQIVWRTQARAEELPSGATVPSIGHTPAEPAPGDPPAIEA